MSQTLSPPLLAVMVWRVLRVCEYSRAQRYRALKETPNTPSRRLVRRACSDAELADQIRVK